MSMSVSILLAIASSLGVVSDAVSPESRQFTVVSWNVASRRGDLQLAALRMAKFQDVHLWGLCDLPDGRTAEMLVDAVRENETGEFVGIISRTEGRDLSCIIYDKTRFELVRAFEIDWTNRLWYTRGMPVRPPLVAHLRHRATGQELLFMVNRLQDCRIDKQAAALNAWAASRSLPVVAVGTYDFQYDPDSGPLCPDGQEALLAFIANGILRWLAPDNPVATLDWDRTVINDFIFVANTLGRLSGRSHIVVEPADFSDDTLGSDHRPIQAVFTVTPVSDAGSASTDLMSTN